MPSCGGPPNADPREQRGAHCLRGIARLKEGTSVQQANAELQTISDQLGKQYPEESSNFIGIATPLQDRLVGSARTPLLVLLGAVGCVLLIVVANVANLLMARATVRARELAIRAAIGADRSTLMRQLLTESVVIALVGGVLGVLLAFWGVDLILALDPGEVPRVAPVSVDGYALGFALLLSLATGVLFGVVPAWQASRPELQSTLKDNTRGSTGDGQRHFARAGLVLAEVSLSLVLLVGAGLLFRSLMTLVDMPMGFSTSRMLTMSVAPTGENYKSPGQFVAYWDRVLETHRRVARRRAGRAHRLRADGRRHERAGLPARQQAGGAAQPAAGQQFRGRRRRLFQHHGHPDRARPRVYARGHDARSARHHHQRGDGAARVSERGSDRPPLLVRAGRAGQSAVGRDCRRGRQRAAVPRRPGAGADHLRAEHAARRRARRT